MLGRRGFSIASLRFVMSSFVGHIYVVDCASLFSLFQRGWMDVFILFFFDKERDGAVQFMR